MPGRRRGAGALALAGLLGCTAGETRAPPAAPRAREPGTFLARALPRPEPAPPPCALAPAPAPALFRSPFGHAISTPPARHVEPSVAGRDLHYWVLGDGPQTVLVLGGIHGDERSSAEAAYDLVAAVLGDPELLRGQRLVVAPEVNPDGIAAGTRRNRRNVDLNRNFPARNWRSDDGASRHGPGLHAASEPETRFVLSLLRRFTPVRVVATHAAAACVNWDGPGEPLARAMSRVCGLPATPTIGYPTPGSLGSLVGIDGGVPTITFELARKDSVSDARDSVRGALLTALHFPDPVPRGARAVAAPSARPADARSGPAERR